MTNPYISPIGFIKQITDDGAAFTLSNAEDSANLSPGTPVTVWRYSPEHLALAKIRGLITAVGYVTATFRAVESAIGPRWPEQEQILREKSPVYLALKGTFEPHPGRMLTQEQANRLQSLGLQYKKLRGGDRQGEARIKRPDEEQ